MAGTGANVYVDLPGFTGDYGDDHSAQVGAQVAGTVDTSGTLKTAWVIIIGALVLLWLLGYSFR
jgi:hypothetical protein